MKEITTALVAAQKEIQNPVKDTKAYNYKYAQLDQILNEVKPILAKHDLVLVQFPVNEDSMVGVETRLLHTSGEHLTDRFVTAVAKNDPQSIGSLITYYRRYSVMALLGLAPEDDDGQKAMPTSNQGISKAQCFSLIKKITNDGKDKEAVEEIKNVLNIDIPIGQYFSGNIDVVEAYNKIKALDF